MSLEDFRTQGSQYITQNTPDGQVLGIKNLLDKTISKFVVVPEETSFEGFKLDYVESSMLRNKANYSTLPIPIGETITEYSTKEPAVFTLRGQVFNEKIKVSELDKLEQELTNGLGTINAYTSKYTGAVLKNFNNVKTKISQGIGFADKLVKDGNSVAKAFGLSNAVEETPVQKMLRIAMTLFQNQVPLNVRAFGLDFDTLKQMRIESLDIEDKTSIEKGRMYYTITFKEILEVRDFNFITIQKNDNRLVFQNAPVQNKGMTAGKMENMESFLSKVFSR